MLLSLETCIQLLLECAGRSLVGRMILERTEQSLNNPSTDITITASCVKSSDMVRITVDNHTPSPSKPNSLSEWSRSSSPNTSVLFLGTLNALGGPTLNLVDWDALRRLQKENDGFLAGEVILLPNGKLMLTIPKEVLPTS